MLDKKLIERFGSVYQAGTVVFREGDSPDAMYIIHQGSVKISIKAKNAEQVLAILRDGDFFGEMAVFTDKNRSATATVAEKSTLLKIKRDSMEYILDNNPGFAHSLIMKLCNRIYNTNSQLEELLVLSKETRVLKAMIQFWKEAGGKNDEQMIIPLDDFIQHVVRNIGIDSANVKRSLNQLKDQNLLKFRRGSDQAVYIAFSRRVFEYFDFA